MASFGKKFLSAFVDVTNEEQHPVTKPEAIITTSTSFTAPDGSVTASEEKFRQYFDRLFKEANLPGPDYFEFEKMTEAMAAITDECTKYNAAFAGLSVQGLDKQKLLNTVAQYIQVLETDAANFNTTVDAALKEKVQGKQQEMESKAKRMEALNNEISELQHQIIQLQQEVKENEEKIESNSGAYIREMQLMKNKMMKDVEKIKEYIR